VGANFNETAAAEELERVFQITKDCCVSVFLEDQLNFNRDVSRLERWVAIAMEKAENMNDRLSPFKSMYCVG
jgi:hypothetical protein